MTFQPQDMSIRSTTSELSKVSEYPNIHRFLRLSLKELSRGEKSSKSKISGYSDTCAAQTLDSWRLGRFDTCAAQTMLTGQPLGHVPAGSQGDPTGPGSRAAPRPGSHGLWAVIAKVAGEIGFLFSPTPARSAATATTRTKWCGSPSRHAATSRHPFARPPGPTIAPVSPAAPAPDYSPRHGLFDRDGGRWVIAQIGSFMTKHSGSLDCLSTNSRGVFPFADQTCSQDRSLDVSKLMTAFSDPSEK